MLTEPFAVLLCLPTRSYSQPFLSSAEFTSFFSTLQDVNKRIKTETSTLTWQKCIYFTANKIDWSCKLNTTKFRIYSNYWQIWYVDIVIFTTHLEHIYLTLPWSTTFNNHTIQQRLVSDEKAYMSYQKDFFFNFVYLVL